MRIENNFKIVRCSVEGCNKLATYNVFISKKPVCVCKNCLSALYESAGKILVPKSPINFLNDKKFEDKKNKNVGFDT